MSVVRVMRGWQDCATWHIALGCAAKCGTNTLAKLAQINGVRKASHGWSDMRQQRIDYSLIPKGYNVIGVVRHPTDRFYSLVQNIRERTRSESNFYRGLEGLNVSDIWRAISKDLDHDYHFQPQYRIGLEKADVLVKLEHLSEWWNNNRPEGATDMPFENRSRGTTIEEYEWVDTRLRKAYCTDFDLWESAA